MKRRREWRRQTRGRRWGLSVGEAKQKLLHMVWWGWKLPVDFSAVIENREKQRERPLFFSLLYA